VCESHPTLTLLLTSHLNYYTFFHHNTHLTHSCTTHSFITILTSHILYYTFLHHNTPLALLPLLILTFRNFLFFFYFFFFSFFPGLRDRAHSSITFRPTPLLHLRHHILAPRPLPGNPPHGSHRTSTPQPKIPPEVDAATRPLPDVAAAVQVQEAREAEEDEEREEEEKALCDLLVYRLRLEKKV
jgi:hypothetical protein